MLNFKGMRFPIDVILVYIRGYASYPLSYRHLEEMMEEHGVSVDHSSINRWAAAKRFFDKAMGASIRRRVLTAIPTRSRWTRAVLTTRSTLVATSRS